MCDHAFSIIIGPVANNLYDYLSLALFYHVLSRLMLSVVIIQLSYKPQCVQFLKLHLAYAPAGNSFD